MLMINKTGKSDSQRCGRIFEVKYISSKIYPSQ